MFLREVLDKNRTATISTMVGVISVACALILWHALGADEETITELRLGYFSTDDGKTYFKDRIDRIVPFEIEGKLAVRAYVYKPEGGEPRVVFLERYTPDGIKQAEKEAAEQREAEAHNAKIMASTPVGQTPKGLIETRARAGIPNWVQVKKAGAPESQWVRANSTEGGNVYAEAAMSGSIVMP